MELFRLPTPRGDVLVSTPRHPGLVATTTSETVTFTPFASSAAELTAVRILVAFHAGSGQATTPGLAIVLDVPAPKASLVDLAPFGIGLGGAESGDGYDLYLGCDTTDECIGADEVHNGFAVRFRQLAAGATRIARLAAAWMPVEDPSRRHASGLDMTEEAVYWAAQLALGIRPRGSPPAAEGRAGRTPMFI
ncbi:MAG: hypothetical protein AB7O78_06130 [Thermoleophilia bacterium]